MYLSVVIPAHNEEKCIGWTLCLVNDYLSKKRYDFEIIVVNDGSEDSTAAIVLEYASRTQGLRLIDSKVNHGKGWAIKRGMSEAKGEYRLFMDADNSTTIEQIEHFLPYIKDGYDVVIGSIKVSGAEVHGLILRHRRLLGFVSSYIIRIITGIWEIQDTQRGFKLFSAVASRKIFPLLTINRFGFDIEMIVIAKELGLRIKEVPIVWSNSIRSSVRLGSYGNTFIELLRIMYNAKCNRYRKRGARIKKADHSFI